MQNGIGHSPEDVTAALSSSDKKIVTNMKEKMKRYQLFLANFEVFCCSLWYYCFCINHLRLYSLCSLNMYIRGTSMTLFSIIWKGDWKPLVLINSWHQWSARVKMHYAWICESWAHKHFHEHGLFTTNHSKAKGPYTTRVSTQWTSSPRVSYSLLGGKKKFNYPCKYGLTI